MIMMIMIMISIVIMIVIVIMIMIMIMIMMIMIMIMIMSTIQGVIEWVISKLDEREADLKLRARLLPEFYDTRSYL